jgi:MoaA/NifB/PqqE/SkfB family radical SAM enzyme
MVEGKSYTSNSTKLLKHLDKLQGMQMGFVSPVMVHIALTGICNLNCSFCCFANRNKKEQLSFEQVKKTLDSFKKLGAKGAELTGGGEPLLHPDINKIIGYAHEIGIKVGICTNGKELGRVSSENWDKVEWVRLGMYGFDQNYIPDLSVFEDKKVFVGAAYVWNDSNLDNFLDMVAFVEKNKIPTRIAVNAIKSVTDIVESMEYVESILNEIPREYAFLSDFNLKISRRNNKCFMHMIKPFVYTDGFVYVCPSAELAEENHSQVNEEFRVCSIEDIELSYSKGVSVRKHNCSFCKYSEQNELIEDILTETDHNDFA